ncbi:MAG: hypothetical protein ABR497_08525 [Kiritimatiellia bacterium]
MTPDAGTARGSVCGAGLLELLLAAALAVLVLGVVMGGYFAALQTGARQAARQSAVAAAAVLDEFSRDLICALAPWGSTNAALLLRPDHPEPAELECRFVTAVPRPGASPDLYDLQEVYYHVRCRAPDDVHVERLSRPWPLPAAMATNTFMQKAIWGPFTAMEVAVWDSGHWTNVWGLADQLELPPAVRVTIDSGTAGPLRLELPIPAGNRPGGAQE